MLVFPWVTNGEKNRRMETAYFEQSILEEDGEKDQCRDRDINSSFYHAAVSYFARHVALCVQVSDHDGTDIIVWSEPDAVRTSA